MTASHYVYEHWRPDKDLPFYVGKGSGRRAMKLYGRNKHHKNVVKKLARLGMCFEVRMVRSGLSAEEAYAFEMERIAFWKKAGVPLVNQNAGGKGGVTPSVQVRSKMSAGIKASIQKMSPEAFAARNVKIGVANHNPSIETREKMRRAKLGRKLSPEHRANIGRSLVGRPCSTETRAKISASHKSRAQG